MKAIVVGAGVLGASITYQLAKRGVSTTLVERAAPGDAASAASFAWLNSNNKELREYHDLSVMSISEWSVIARQLGRSSWLHPTGNVHVASTVSDAEALATRVARLNSYGYAAIPLRPVDLEDIDSTVRVRSEYEYAALFPSEGFISTSLLIHDLLAVSRTFGATVHLGAGVSEFIGEGNTITGVALSNGDRIEADIVIAAAGAHLGELLSTRDIQVRTAGTPGASVTTSPGASNLSTVLHLPGLSIRPDGAGRLVIRSKEADQQIETGTSTLPTQTALCLVEDAGERLNDFDPAATTVERVKVASRPYLYDGLPVVGHWDGLPGLYVTTMHSGVTLGAIISRLVAEEILSGEPAPLLEGFRPNRVLEATANGAEYRDPYATAFNPHALEGEEGSEERGRGLNGHPHLRAL